MGCTSCGEKPKNTAKDFTKAVIEINNPETLVLLRKVVIPTSMGDDKQVPPEIGKYHNVILQYEANKHVYIYSSDGIPTFIEAEDTSGGDSDIIELTRADYNYPEDNPNSIALWKLESGIYCGTGITVKSSVGASTTVGGDPKSYFYIENDGIEADILVLKPFSDMITRYKTLVADGARRSSTSFTVLDTLTSTRDDCALSANQGKVLNGRIGDLSTLITTNKTSAVAAINEIASGGGGQSYTAGDGIDITDDTISVDTDVIQPKLTAGTNITIDENNVISAQGGSSVNVVQATGTSTTDVMSQKAVTDTIFHDNDTTKIQIGSRASSTGDTYYPSVAIGANATATGGSAVAVGRSTASRSNSVALGSGSATGQGSVAIGCSSSAGGAGSIAIGGYSGSNDNANTYRKGSIVIGVGATAAADGEFNIGDRSGGYGYNNSNYRLLTGLYDPQSAHDAATKGYVDTAVAGVSTNTISSQDWSALWQ